MASEPFRMSNIGQRETAVWLLALICLAVLYSIPATDVAGWLVPLLPLLTAGIIGLAIWYFRAPHALVGLIFFVAIFQNVLIALFNRGGRNPQTVLPLVAFTTALPSLVGVASLIARRASILNRSVLTLHVTAAAYLLVVMFGAATSSQPIAAQIPAFRNAVSFILLFYAGYLLPGTSAHELRRIIRTFVVLMAATVAFAYLERFALGDAFWTEFLNIEFISQAKHLPPTSASEYPVPMDFYSPLWGVYVRRVPSFFATPITMGYFAAFALFVCCYFVIRSHGTARTRAVVGTALLCVTLVLTLVKGAYQIAVLGLAALVLGVRYASRSGSFSRLLAVWLLLSLPVTIAGIFFFRDSTAFLHLYGLILTFNSMQGGELLMGNGLGSGGRISERLGADITIERDMGAESGIGTTLYQFGLPGVALYIIFMVLIMRNLYGVYRDGKARRDVGLFALCVMAANFGLLSNAFLQENAFAPIPSSFFLIFAGLAINVARRNEGEIAGGADDWQR